MTNTLQQVVERINRSTTLQETSSGTKPGYAVAGEYAFSVAKQKNRQPLQQVERVLQELESAGARFDFHKAAAHARRLCILNVLEEAGKHLGKKASIAEVVSYVAGDDGSKFVVWEGGNLIPAVTLKDLCAAVAQSKKTAVRYEFADGSAIITTPSYWDLEGSHEFVMLWAEL